MIINKDLIIQNNYNCYRVTKFNDLVFQTKYFIELQNFIFNNFGYVTIDYAHNCLFYDNYYHGNSYQLIKDKVIVGILHCYRF